MTTDGRVNVVQVSPASASDGIRVFDYSLFADAELSVIAVQDAVCIYSDGTCVQSIRPVCGENVTSVSFCHATGSIAAGVGEAVFVFALDETDRYFGRPHWAACACIGAADVVGSVSTVVFAASGAFIALGGSAGAALLHATAFMQPDAVFDAATAAVTPQWLPLTAPALSPEGIGAPSAAFRASAVELSDFIASGVQKDASGVDAAQPPTPAVDCTVAVSSDCRIVASLNAGGASKDVSLFLQAAPMVCEDAAVAARSFTSGRGDTGAPWRTGDVPAGGTHDLVGLRHVALRHPALPLDCRFAPPSPRSDLSTATTVVSFNWPITPAVLATVAADGLVRVFSETTFSEAVGFVLSCVIDERPAGSVPTRVPGVEVRGVVMHNGTASPRTAAPSTPNLPSSPPEASPTFPCSPTAAAASRAAARSSISWVLSSHFPGDAARVAAAASVSGGGSRCPSCVCSCSCHA